jgi:hypothetical protein
MALESLNQEIELLRAAWVARFGSPNVIRKFIDALVIGDMDISIYRVRQTRLLIEAAGSAGGGANGEGDEGVREAKTFYGNGRNVVFTVVGMPDDARNFDCYVNGLHYNEGAYYQVDVASKTLYTNFGFIPVADTEITLVYSTSVASA